jgi:hypothetical protein
MTVYIKIKQEITTDLGVIVRSSGGRDSDRERRADNMAALMACDLVDSGFPFLPAANIHFNVFISVSACIRS